MRRRRIMADGKVVLVTGASSGFGAATVAELVRAGHRVYGTSRRAAPPPADAPHPTMLPMDVRDAASVAAAVDLVLAREGRIDVLVNNAGVGIAGAVEDTSDQETQALFDTNLFGAHRLIRAVLPAMRRQGGGLIVNVGSMAGEIAIPFQAFYSATKAALAALSHALRIEAAPHGIVVTLLEPGDFRTGFTEHRETAAAAGTNPAYRDRCRQAVGVMERDEQHGADPAAVARLIADLVGRARPRPAYLIGMWAQRLAVRVARVAPGRLREWLLRAYYGV